MPCACGAIVRESEDVSWLFGGVRLSEVVVARSAHAACRPSRVSWRTARDTRECVPPSACRPARGHRCAEIEDLVHGRWRRGRRLRGRRGRPRWGRRRQRKRWGAQGWWPRLEKAEWIRTGRLPGG
eukprot:4156269-Prymnesium_polylepis.1